MTCCVDSKTNAGSSFTQLWVRREDLEEGSSRSSVADRGFCVYTSGNPNRRCRPIRKLRKRVQLKYTKTNAPTDQWWPSLCNIHSETLICCHLRWKSREGFRSRLAVCRGNRKDFVFLLFELDISAGWNSESCRFCTHARNPLTSGSEHPTRLD